MMRVFLVLVLAAAVAGTAAAQSDSAQISGFVRDAQQGALPGATVAITNEATRNSRSTVTNSTGFYVLPDIPVGVYQYQSGSPFSVRSNDDFAGVGPGSGNQFWSLVGDPAIDRGPFGASAPWFNPAAFARPAAGTFGVQPRNALRNPATWNFDLGVRKNVPLSGSHQLQFRVEAFNALNHPNWGSSATNVANNNPNSGSFGLVTNKFGDRVIQLSTKYSF